MKNTFNFVYYLAFLFVLLTSCKKDVENQEITNTNNNPILTSISDVKITAGDIDSVQIIGIDADNEQLLFNIEDNPGFLQFGQMEFVGNATSSWLKLETTKELAGAFSPTIIATDPNGNSDQLQLNIQVEEYIPFVIDTNVIKMLDVNITNISEFEVLSSYVGLSSLNSDFIYAIIKVQYNGNDDKSFVKIEGDLLDHSGERICGIKTYFDQENLARTSADNTNTFVSPEYNIGYFTLIEDLGIIDKGLSDISSLNVEVSYLSYSYQLPWGHLKISDYYRVEDDSWYVDYENDQEQIVQSYYSKVLLIDDEGRAFKFTYLDNFKWSQEGQAVEIENGVYLFPGDKGYCRSLDITPNYYEDYNLEVETMIIEWREPDKSLNRFSESQIQKQLEQKLRSNQYSTDEKNLFIHRAINTRRLIESKR
jgi:hypothetical protein